MSLFRDLCAKIGLDGELEQQAEAFVKDKLFGDDAPPERSDDAGDQQDAQDD